MWNKLWLKLHKTSRSATLTQTLYFIYSRLHLTTRSISSFSLNSKALCCSCPSLHSDLKQLLFSCPAALSFWHSDWRQINRIFHTSLIFNILSTFMSSLDDQFHLSHYDKKKLFYLPLHSNKLLLTGKMHQAFPLKCSGMQFTIIIDWTEHIQFSPLKFTIETLYSSLSQKF